MVEPLTLGSAGDWQPFAVGALRCPECGEALPVPVLARIVEEPARFGHPGTDKCIEVSAQTDDVFAHWWAHGKGGGGHCHHWSGWLYGPPVPEELTGREYCHLPLGHNGPHTDGHRQWWGVRDPLEN